MQANHRVNLLSEEKKTNLKLKINVILNFIEEKRFVHSVKFSLTYLLFKLI